MRAFKRFDIVAGISTSLLLFALLATYFYSHAQKENTLSTERQLNRHAQSVIAIKTDLLSIRELEKEYLLRPQAQHAEQLSAQLSSTISNTISGEIYSSQISRADVLNSLQTYQGAVSDTVRLVSDLGLDHNSGLQGKFRRAAHTAEALFDELQDDFLQAELMYLRRHEKDFILRLDAAYRTQFINRMGALRSAVFERPISAQQKQRLLSHLNTYEQSFILWTEHRMRLVAVTEMSDATFTNLTRYFDRITSTLLAKAQALETQRRKAVITSEVSLLLAGLMGTAFCLMLLRLVFQQRRLANEITALAQHDTLTGLSNRRGFAVQLEADLRLRTTGPDTLILGLVDLDGFKSVNDVYGHGAGDLLLRKAARRMQQILPKGTFLARLGGDEFGLITHFDANENEIRALGHSICAALKQPFFLKEGVARISGSIGFTVARADDVDMSALVERADYALNYSKEHSMGEPVLFSNHHERAIEHARELERIMINAHFEDELDIMFQPIVNPVSGAILGMESLARWNSTMAGTVPPSDFIHLAEKLGKINEITQVVLKKTLHVAREWPSDIFISVNLSAMDVASDEAANRLIKTVHASGVPPQRLVFELTETMLMQEFDRTNAILDRFRALGIGIALDDFGTGYSSLSYLQHMKIDRLKIDRAFIADIDTNATSQQVLDGIIQLCANLNIDCIVEGVETESQRKIITQSGAMLAQGYYFARPVPNSELQALLSKKNAA